MGLNSILYKLIVGVRHYMSVRLDKWGGPGCFGLVFLIPLLCSRFTASFVMLLKSWSTLRMSSLRVCSRERPGYLMTSTKDQVMVLMMHSSMQSRKDTFSTSRGLFHNYREVFPGIDPS